MWVVTFTYLLQWFFYTFLGSWDNQGNISNTMVLLLWLGYIFFASYTDQEQNAMSIPSLQQLFHISFWVSHLLAINFITLSLFQWVGSTILIPLETILRLWFLKNSSFFIYTLQNWTSSDTQISEPTDCKQPVVVPET